MPYNIKDGSAKNSDSAKKLYEERNRYRIDSLDLPNFKDESSFIDMWYERPLYGRADTTGDMVIPIQKSGLAQLPGSNSIFAVDFVAASFVDMRNDLLSAIQRNRFPEEIGKIKRFQAKRAWSDPDTLYETHLDTLKTNFIREYLLPNRKKIVRPMSICSYLEEYVERNAARHPMSFTGFLGSRLCPPHSSGLVIDLIEESHGSDEEKLQIINSPFFKQYVTAANRHGFFVNKNAPWSLVANLESGKMSDLMKQFGVADRENYFFEYCVKSYNMDVKKLQDFVFDIYYTLFTIDPVVRENSVCNKTNTIIRNVKKRKVLTLPQLRDSIPTKYWLRLYYLIRANETRANITAAESKRFLKNVGVFLKRDGNIKRGIRRINTFFKSKDSRISTEPFIEFLESLDKDELSKFMSRIKTVPADIGEPEEGEIGKGGLFLEDSDEGLASNDEKKFII